MLAAVAAMSGVAAFLSVDLVEASNPANMCCGFYSCIGANVPFFLRRDRTVAILTDLRAVARETEKDNDPEVQVRHFFVISLVAFPLY